MLTRGLVVLALLFGVISMHQLVGPEAVAGGSHAAAVADHTPAPVDHEDHGSGLHQCLGLIVIAVGLVVAGLLGQAVRAAPPSPRSHPIGYRARRAPPAWRAPDLSRLCVLRL